MIYLTLFGIGKIIFGHWGTGLLWLGGAVISGAYLYWDLNRRGWSLLTDQPAPK